MNIDNVPMQKPVNSVLQSNRKPSNSSLAPRVTKYFVNGRPVMGYSNETKPISRQTSTYTPPKAYPPTRKSWKFGKTYNKNNISSDHFLYLLTKSKNRYVL